MTYEVKSSDASTIVLCEADTVASVLQNVAIILGTRQGTVPLYRDFGLPMNFVDKPTQVAKTMVYAEVWEALQKYEPRAELVSVDFMEHSDSPGRLEVIVEVSISNG